MFAGSLRYQSVGKKILVLITGYKMDISKIKSKRHIFPMENVAEPTAESRKLVIVPREKNWDKIVERLYRATEMG